MNREEKGTTVERLHGGFQEVTHAILVDFRGLTVAETNDLRRKVRAGSGRYEVVKNRLAMRASAETILAGLVDRFRGPTAILTGSGDPVPLVRLVRDFSRDHPSLEVKAGWIEGQALDGAGMTRIANLPGRDQLIARFAGALTAPLSRFCRALQSPLCDFVLVLKEISRQKS